MRVESALNVVSTLIYLKRLEIGLCTLSQSCVSQKKTNIFLSLGASNTEQILELSPSGTFNLTSTHWLILDTQSQGTNAHFCLPILVNISTAGICVILLAPS